MSKWDELWENKPTSHGIYFNQLDWEKKVKAEGDRLQSENQAIRKTEPEWTRYFDESMRVVLEQKNKLDAIGEIINPNYDPWKQLADIREILDS